MTREIKFRAWDGVNMIPNVSVSMGRHWYVEFDHYTKERGSKRSDFYLIEDYPIMQFTGLLDKNGKEIYENDLVQLDNWEPKIHEVVFDRGVFCFRSSKDATFYNDCKYLEESEVVGNVFENPDLLKNEK